MEGSSSEESGTTSQEVVLDEECLSTKGLTESEDRSDGPRDSEGHSEAKEIEQRDTMDEMDPRFRAFRKAFYGYFRWAVSSFDGEPVKLVRKDCPKAFYVYADYLIATGSSKALAPNQSRIGRLNGLVYAAARTIHQFWRQEVGHHQQSEKGWYAKTTATQEEPEQIISITESELARRKEKRKPNAEELENIHKIAGKLGTRSTSSIVRTPEAEVAERSNQCAGAREGAETTAQAIRRNPFT